MTNQELIAAVVAQLKAEGSDINTRAVLDNLQNVGYLVGTNAATGYLHRVSNELFLTEDAMASTTGQSTTKVMHQKAVTDALSNKADLTNVYTKSQVDTLVSGKANASDVYTKSDVTSALALKQDKLTWDSTPTLNSSNPVTSDGIKKALNAKADKADVYTKTEANTLLAGKQDKLTFDDTPTANSTNPVTSGGINTALASKADVSSLPDVVQVTGSSTTAVMSQNAVTTALDATANQIQEIRGQITTNITLPWSRGFYFPTSASAIESGIYMTPAQSSVHSCLRVDLTGAIAITVHCVGSASNTAVPYFFVDASGVILDIGVRNQEINTTFDASNIPSGAVALYLNHYNSNKKGISALCVKTVDSINERFEEIYGHINNINADLYVNEIAEWTDNRYFATNNNHTIGEAGTIATTQSSLFKCLFVDLTLPISKITFCTNGSNNNIAHPYYFLDEDNKILDIETSHNEVNREFTRETWPSGAVALYLNCLKSDLAEPSCFITKIVAGHGSLPLQGKNVVMFGDSITEFTGSKGKAYSDYFAEVTGANVYNVGIGGSRLTRTRERTDIGDPASNNMDGLCVTEMVDAWIENDFTNPTRWAEWRATQGDTHDAEQVARLQSISPENTDFVTILAGTNDWGSVDIGTPSSTDVVKNIFGTIKHIVEALHTAFPKLQIYIFTPPVRNGSRGWCDDYDSDKTAGSYTGTTLSELCAGIMAAAKCVHVPCCDLYWGMGWNRYNWAAIAPDGIHPTNGFEALGRKIAAFVASMG